MQRTWWVVLLFAGLALAGCTDAPADAGMDGTADDDPTMPEDPGLTADSVVEAPQWEVGDYFGHHIFFGSEDTSGTHIDAVVVDVSGSEYTLVSDQREAARWESAWDFPMLGTIGKQHLETTAFSDDWNLYDFPLSDGKTWTATFNPLFSGPRELTMTATFDPAIPTVGQGKKEGFRIEGVNQDGAVELVTDYIPEIGWYSELTYVDRTTNPDATDDDFVIRVWGMGQGSDWEGTTIVAEATPQVALGSCFAPLNQDGTLNQGCLSAGAITSFMVEEETDELYGLTFLLAIAGHSRSDLLDPGFAAETHEATSTGLEDVATVFEFQRVVDPEPGQWTHKWDGEGFVSVGSTQLWSIVYTETPFPDGA